MSSWSLLVLSLPVLSSLLCGCAATVRATGPVPPFVALRGPVIIAHRGGSLEAPENTIEAVRHGVACGADWQEVDVTMSRDEQVVVIHDDTVDRTTDGSGRVDRLSLTELQALHAGRPRWAQSAVARMSDQGVDPPDFGDRFATARIPTLEEVLATPDARLMIELKSGGLGSKLAEKVVETVRRCAAADRVAIASSDPALLTAVHDREPSLPLVAVVDSPAAAEAMLQLPITVLATRVDHSPEVIKVTPPNVAVWVWTVYSAATVQGLVELGVHGIITDVPQAVVQAVRPEVDPMLRAGE